MTIINCDVRKISTLIFVLSLVSGSASGFNSDNYITAIKKSPLDFAAISSQLGSAERMRYGKRNGFDVNMLPHVYKLTEIGKRDVNEDVDKRSSKYIMELGEYQNLGKRSDNFIPEMAKFNEVGKKSLPGYLQEVNEFNKVGKRNNAQFDGDLLQKYHELGKRSTLSEINDYNSVGKRSNDFLPHIAEFEKFGKRDSSYLREIGKFRELGRRASYNQILPIYENVGKRSVYPFYPGGEAYYYDSVGKRLSSIIKNVADYNEVGKRSTGLIPNLAHYDDFGKRSDDYENLNYYFQHGKRSPNLNAIVQHLNDVDRLRFGK
uniref:Orcokinin peptides type B n=1 Tax=Strongyloides venezuelensis TaxID=75913 RepID=A0A0K0ETZ8_STRVS